MTAPTKKVPVTAPTKKLQKDWIERMNDLTDVKGWDDRMMCELFIMFLSHIGRGEAFYKWLEEEAKRDTIGIG